MNTGKMMIKTSSDLTLFRRPAHPSDLKAEAEAHFERNRPAIEAMAKMVSRFKAGEPIYVKINEGTRAGSIARVHRKALVLHTLPLDGIGTGAIKSKANIINSYVSDDFPNVVAKIGWEADILASFVGSRGGRSPIFWVGFLEMLEFQCYHSALYEFDGRKPVRTNYSDLNNLEVLLDYEGPTKFVFTRAESKSAEEKEEERRAKVNELAFTPIDKFGNELAVGDMFIFARSDELLFLKLKKVSQHGFIVGTDLITKREVSLQAKASIAATKGSIKNAALAKFSKDEILSQKLMMEKLKR
jgi:hypothetical protein